MGRSRCYGGAAWAAIASKLLAMTPEPDPALGAREAVIENAVQPMRAQHADLAFTADAPPLAAPKPALPFVRPCRCCAQPWFPRLALQRVEFEQSQGSPLPMPPRAGSESLERPDFGRLSFS